MVDGDRVLFDDVIGMGARVVVLGFFAGSEARDAKVVFVASIVGA
jgi:hypothetical protein